MSSFQNVIASEKRNRPHVVIAGAGIGGLTLAIRLTDLGFPVSVLEARSEESATGEGVFLTLAPNGMNGLRTVGCHEVARAAGIDTIGIEINNAGGKRLGYADQRDHATTFGAPSVTLSRGVLARIILERARQAGAEIRFGARVASLVPSPEGVAIGLDDGAVIDTEILVAADGLRSTVRALAFPDYPKPAYTGLIGTGGMVQATAVPSTGGVMRMTFGNNAFFGYIRDGDGPVYWFNSYAADEHDAVRIANPAAYAQKIATMHASDPSENRAILRAVTAIDRNYPVYDVPELPVWHRGRIVLLGDAAHAVGPHAGQGASMAIEDAVVLAACLDAEAEPEAAFARFEALRRERVAEVVKLTHRNSSQKRTKGRFGLFVRDLILPVLIPVGIRMGRKLLAHRVDLDPMALRQA